MFELALQKLRHNTAFLTNLSEKCKSSPHSVTADEVVQAISCTQSRQLNAAGLFCRAVCDLAIKAKAPGCDVIAAAGGVSAIVQLLAWFPDDQVVTDAACGALFFMSANGSEAVKAMLRAHPDINTVLESASHRLRAWGEDDYAAWALKKLHVLKA